MRSRQVSFTSRVTINDDEVEVTVEGDYIPGFAGTMYARNGDPGDPPESAECEITSVDGPNGPIAFDSLSDSDQNRLIEEGIAKGDEPDYYGE